MALHLYLGFLHSRDFRGALLSANSHCRPWVHVSLSQSTRDIWTGILLILTTYFSSIAQAQLLNLPITILGLIVIGVSGVFADNGRLPRPLYPLSFLTIILACYGVLVAYPNSGGVYAATMIGNAGM